MQDVAAVNLRVAMDIAIHHGLPAATLLSGLGVTEAELRDGRRRRYDWETYAEMLDRIAAHRGGVEHMPTIGEGVPGAFPEGVAIASAFVEPRLLYRFVNLVLEPSLFPMFEISLQDREDGKMVLTWALRPGYRECEAFIHASLGTVRVLPTIIGLPPARVDPVELTGKRGVYLIQLPESRTLFARAKRLALDAFGMQAVREMERDKSELLEKFRELEVREAALARETAARERAQESLSRVVSSVSNAAFLVSGNEVTGVNPSASAALSRRSALREEVLAAARAGGACGFDVAPAGPGQVIVLLRGPGEEIERRLTVAVERWNLTPRQLDVLRALVEGLNNQEIATRLACTARTVEVHVTGLLDKAGAGSRLQVVAAFWADL